MELSEDLRKNLVLVGISFLVVAGTAAASNIATPDNPVNVGMLEVETECVGIDAGVCLGIQRQQHTTYNYQNYTEAEPGTENYYRRIESELMIRAYNTCNSSMSGYDWTTEVSYEGQTAEEWRQNENIQLLPCEQTFHRELNATS